MSEEIVETPEQEVPPTPEPEAIVVEVKEYRYQPTDDSGRPIGGVQVLKYTTQEELVEKLQEQNVLILRRLRQETRKNRLGIVEEGEVPAEAPRFHTVEFNSRTLTPDERFQLSRDINDPEKFDDAADTLLEYKLGLKPADLRHTLQQQQDAIIAFRAQQEIAAFKEDNPDYYKCQENSDAITGWMSKRGLDPVKDNFQLAYDTLRHAGVIVEGPAAQTYMPPPAPVSAEPPVVEQEAPAPVPEPEEVKPVRPPSGLSRSQASTVGPVRIPGEDIVYEYIDHRAGTKKILKGLAAVNAMPADEFKNRCNKERGFAKKVEALEREAESARQRKMAQQ